MCCARQAASWPGVIELTSEPATRIVPLVGLSSPASRFSRVDLPEPEGPIRAVKEPSLMSRERSVKISIRSESRWNTLWTSRISTRAIGFSVDCHPERSEGGHAGLFPDLHPHACLRLLHAPDQQLLSPGQSRAHLAESGAHRPRLHRTRLQPAVPYQPYDALAVHLAHSRRRDPEPWRAGARGRL